MTLQIFTWYNCRSLEALTRVAIHRSESFMRPFRAMQVPPRIAPCFTRPRRSEASHVFYSHRPLLLGFKASGLSALAATTGRYLNANDSLTGSCELCGLDRDLTVHHLVPKVHWRRMRKKRQVTGKDELGPKKPLRSWFQSHEASKSLALQDLSASAFEKTSTRAAFIGPVTVWCTGPSVIASLDATSTRSRLEASVFSKEISLRMALIDLLHWDCKLFRTMSEALKEADELQDYLESRRPWGAIHSGLRSLRNRPFLHLHKRGCVS